MRSSWFEAFSKLSADRITLHHANVTLRGWRMRRDPSREENTWYTWSTECYPGLREYRGRVMPGKRARWAHQSDKKPMTFGMLKRSTTLQWNCFSSGQSMRPGRNSSPYQRAEWCKDNRYSCESTDLAPSGTEKLSKEVVVDATRRKCSP